MDKIELFHVLQYKINKNRWDEKVFWEQNEEKMMMKVQRICYSSNSISIYYAGENEGKCDEVNFSGGFKTTSYKAKI